MEKKDVIEFFDKLAPEWDSQQIPKDEIINTILDNAKIHSGIKVLDVACGTGILFSYYLERGITDIVGIDISKEMAAKAIEKYKDNPHIRVICGDVETENFTETFDTVMIYNAFPHFPDPKRLISIVSGLLSPGGRICIAHSMSRETVDAHHHGCACHVSMGLMEAHELKDLMQPYFDVDVVISDDRMYQVAGVKTA